MRAVAFLFLVLVVQLLSLASAQASVSSSTSSPAPSVTSAPILLLTSVAGNSSADECEASIGVGKVCSVLDLLNQYQGLWVALTVPGGILVAVLGGLSWAFRKQIQGCFTKVQDTEDELNRKLGMTTTPGDAQADGAGRGQLTAEMTNLKEKERKDVAALESRMAALEESVNAAPVHAKRTSPVRTTAKANAGVAPVKTRSSYLPRAADDEKEQGDTDDAAGEDDVVPRMKIRTGDSGGYHEGEHPRPISAPPGASYRPTSRQGGGYNGPQYLTLPGPAHGQDASAGHRRSQSEEESGSAAPHQTINVVPPWSPQEAQRSQSQYGASFSPLAGSGGPSFRDTAAPSSRPASPYPSMQPQTAEQAQQWQAMSWQYSAPPSQLPYIVPPNSPAAHAYAPPHPQSFPFYPPPSPQPQYSLLNPYAFYSGGMGGAGVGASSQQPQPQLAAPSSAVGADGAASKQLLELLSAVLAQQPQPQLSAAALPSQPAMQYAQSAMPLQWMPPAQPLQPYQTAQPTQMHMEQLILQLQHTLAQQQQRPQQPQMALSPHPSQPLSSAAPLSSALSAPVSVHIPPSPSSSLSPLIAVSSPTSDDQVNLTWHMEDDTTAEHGIEPARPRKSM